jgi:hypothetical protein
MSRHDEDIATGRPAAGQVPLFWTRQASFELGCPVRGDRQCGGCHQAAAEQWEASVMGEQLPGSWATPRQARVAVERRWHARTG